MQSVSKPPASATSPAPTGTTDNVDIGTSTEAASKLAEAIDDFLGDLEKKFKGISDEILTKLDDMADRCDRLEQEMLLREASGMEAITKPSTGSTAGSA